MTTEPTPLSTPAENVTAAPASAPVAASPPGAPAWWLKVDVLLFVLLLILSFFLASFIATNSDLWLNLAIGKRLSEGAFHFGVDPFSWATEATANRPAPYWVHHGWLTSWLFYQGFLTLGGSGLVIVKAILVTLTIALLSRIGWKESTRWFLLICLTMAAIALSPRLLLQSTIISYLFLALTLFLLDRAGLFASHAAEDTPAQPRALWGLPPLFVLWANLDQWFILGLVLIALCWGATRLRHKFHIPATVPGKTVGIVLGACILACLLNPHHVHVFQLPPELAYLLVTAQIPLPDALVGGGRTLQIIRQTDPDYVWTLSPVSSRYFLNQGYGLNIAGLAFYPLLVLGMVAFTLSALTKQQTGAPSFIPARFLVWLIFAMMALALYRMIAFFVIVAAPLTALTLGEFLHWQQVQSAVPAERRDRGLHLARMVSVPFLLLLLVFAWPGWISNTTDLYRYNTRRVAWGVRPDSSLRKAALTLQALKDRRECGNVFNFSFDLPFYCAWYAPDVKCFMDTRFALFTEDAPVFIKARQALVDPRKPERDWQKLFAEHQVDQAAPVNFLSTRQMEEIQASRNYLTGPHLRWWLDADHWRQRYGDNRTMIFSWAGPERTWPINTSRSDRDRRAFGAVPLEARPPSEGTLQPHAPGLWHWYLHGIGPQPQESIETRLLGIHFHTQQRYMQMMRAQGSLIFCGTLVSVQAVPGGGLTMGPSFAALMATLRMAPALDNGPPALPILMVRAARRAVAENPSDSASQITMQDAYELLRGEQEDYWAGRNAQASKLRERVRQLQSISSLFSVVELQPDRFEPCYVLAENYQRSWLLDSALELMQRAEKNLLATQSAARNPSKQLEAVIKKYQADIKILERRVQLRLVKLQEISGGKSALDVAEIAYGGKYAEAMGEAMVDTPLGLAHKALEILQGIKVDSLKPADQLRYLQLRFDLLLALGNVDVVAVDLREENVRKALPPVLLAQYRIFAGGALGDYDMMSKGLVELEALFSKGAAMRRSLWVTAVCLPAGMQSPSVFASTLTVGTIYPLRVMNDQYNELFNAMTLRGIAALEAGDTKTARRVFQEIAAQAGTELHFSDQMIARRYRELLNKQP